ncbi:hypothetical protein CQW23_02839 [Capsicum baccatum]|uniref:Uncharacterized protein n=1 Tax=Capsicum baccatum TaxID=33114 RepID=A0A2G2XSK1_CAPBA|nr:hypothetical protein CQW23_02839 [Capsicum baccatum]
MEARYLYFTIHSASNLKDVRKLGEMKVYAKVSIAGKSKYTSARSCEQDKPCVEYHILLHRARGECTFPVHRNDSNQSKRFGTLKFSHELGDEVLVVVSNSSSSTENSNA